jgi:hypothetical protein
MGLPTEHEVAQANALDALEQTLEEGRAEWHSRSRERADTVERCTWRLVTLHVVQAHLHVDVLSTSESLRIVW